MAEDLSAMTSRVTAAVPTRLRLPLALLLGCASGVRAHQLSQHAPNDFSQVWFAARALLAGANPYPLIGPGRAFAWQWPFFYPLPAAIVAVPFAPLQMAWASAAFVAVGAGVFAWALMAQGVASLLLSLSAATLVAVELAQWSPLLAAAFVLSPLSVAFVAKPTLGAALFVARPSWWAIVGGVLLSAVAFALHPGWFGDWLGGFVHPTRPLHFRAPVMHPGGVLTLLALRRWRRPEARLLAAMACVPQSMILYEAVPLCLIPRGVRECAAFLLLTYAAQAALVLSADDLIATGRWIVWLLYLPATAMVLRRPNEGLVPRWFERRIARWPAWLRGVPARA
jgi:hypothetical protein